MYINDILYFVIMCFLIQMTTTNNGLVAACLEDVWEKKKVVKK
jgi:hypothetical protein